MQPRQATFCAAISRSLVPKTYEGFDSPVIHLSVSAFGTTSHMTKDDDSKELKRRNKASTKSSVIFRDFKELGVITRLLFHALDVLLATTLPSGA